MHWIISKKRGSMLSEDLKKEDNFFPFCLFSLLPQEDEKSIILNVLQLYINSYTIS